MKRITLFLMCFVFVFTMFGCQNTQTNQSSEQIAKVDTISLDLENVNMALGEQAQVYAIVNMSDGSRSQDIVWSTSDPDIVTVHDGTLEAVGLGSVEISAQAKKDGSKVDVCNVVVHEKTENLKVQNIQISKNEININVGNFAKLDAVCVMDDYSTNQNIKWESSNQNVALVSNGTVFAENAGTTNITAISVLDNTKVATCVVNVTRAQLELPKNYLFLGDDLIDGAIGGGRQKNPYKMWDQNHVMGQNFVYHINASYGSSHSEKQINFVNRGNAQSKVGDLLANIDSYLNETNADIITIDVGVNDLPLMQDGEASIQTSFFDFAINYMNVLERVKTIRPNATIVICEPFIGTTGKYVDGNYEKIRKVLDNYIRKIKDIANDYQAIYVPMQDAFDEKVMFSNVDWIVDGIHPTEAGQQLMAEQWIKYVIK